MARKTVPLSPTFCATVKHWGQPVGVYPETSLVDARKVCDTIRAQVAKGNAPNIIKRQAALVAMKAAPTTYESVAKEFHSVKSPGWSEGHAAKSLKSSRPMSDGTIVAMTRREREWK